MCKHFTLKDGKTHFCKKYKVEVEVITKRLSACQCGSLLCYEEEERKKQNGQNK